MLILQGDFFSQQVNVFAAMPKITALNLTLIDSTN